MHFRNLLYGDHLLNQGYRFESSRKPQTLEVKELRKNGQTRGKPKWRPS